MSRYGLNRKTFRDRLKTAPEYLLAHNNFLEKLIYALRNLDFIVIEASEKEQLQGKFDFKILRQGRWVLYDVKIAEDLPRQVRGVKTEEEAVTDLLSFQGLQRHNVTNKIFWLLSQNQRREALTERDYTFAALEAAYRLHKNQILRNLTYVTFGANEEDRLKFSHLVGKKWTIAEVMLITSRKDIIFKYPGKSRYFLV